MPISTPTKAPKPLSKPPKWPDLWFKDPSLNHVLFKMHLDQKPITNANTNNYNSKKRNFKDQISTVDHFSLLTDSLHLRIFSLLPPSQHGPNSLVCKRWLALHGRLRRRLRLLDWRFLAEGRMLSRFPDLVELDLVPASVEPCAASGVFLTHPCLSVPVDAASLCAAGGRLLLHDSHFFPPDAVDGGLRLVSHGLPCLRRLALVAGTDAGLASVAAGCDTLMDLELHRCTDLALRAIAACANLQILRLVGCSEGIYEMAISDVGLTIVAHGCPRLVKLELGGCGGSCEGIGAIGMCCPMLEELTLADHRMEAGWLGAVAVCTNLKTLRLENCKRIDEEPGPAEALGVCEALETLQILRCQIREKQSMAALFAVCTSVREIKLQDCWGLDDDMFSVASVCRRVKYLSLEGCSLLTTEGLESAILSWNDLQRLSIVSCNNIRDSDVSPALSTLFSNLKEFKWQPDSRSVLVLSLEGTGMRTKGGRFFKRV